MSAVSDSQVAQLRTTIDAFTRRYKVSDARDGERRLNEIDNQTLLYVLDHPSCGPSDVARHLGVAATTMSAATDRLARRGFLLRARPRDDRRAVSLSLSDEGLAYVRSCIASHEALFRKMLERLAPAERETFLALITKISFDVD